MNLSKVILMAVLCTWSVLVRESPASDGMELFHPPSGFTRESMVEPPSPAPPDERTLQPDAPQSGGRTPSGTPEHPVVSPVDTIPMSPLERFFWRRHGLMRRMGVFPLDEEHPVNDFRQMARARRKMLSLHQTFGLLTIASMGLTVYGGQRAIDGHGTGFHNATLPFTIGLYTATAMMALASPPKLVRRPGGGADTVTYHKIFAVMHFGGMILTPLIAPESEDIGTGSNKLRAHQVTGYITFGTFLAGFLIISLFR